MTIHVNIGEAKTRLSELVAAAVRGEEVVLQRAGQPQVRLIPVAERSEAERERIIAKRRAAFGMYRHLVSDPDIVAGKLMTEEEQEESYGGNLALLLLDTHALLWSATGSSRLSPAARAAVIDSDAVIQVSAVTAWEYVELNRRGRFGGDVPLQAILDQLEATVIALPAEAWRVSPTLPLLHKDPVDRMMIAHAIAAGLTLVTADATIRRYPVRTLW